MSRSDPPTEASVIDRATSEDYKYGFVTEIESDTAPPGLNPDVVRLISSRKNEPDWLLEWRLRSLERFEKIEAAQGSPRWANLKFPPLDFQAMSYYSAPKPKKELASLDEVDPELLEAFDKLGISLEEQKRLSGVAVDAVFDSVSVATTFKGKLAELGIIFCSFPKRSRITPTWFASTWAPSSPPATTSTPHSTPPSSRMARLPTFQRACAVRWNSPLTFASTPQTQDSSSGRC